MNLKITIIGLTFLLPSITGIAQNSAVQLSGLNVNSAPVASADPPTSNSTTYGKTMYFIEFIIDDPAMASKAILNLMSNDGSVIYSGVANFIQTNGEYSIDIDGKTSILHKIPLGYDTTNTSSTAKYEYFGDIPVMLGNQEISAWKSTSLFAIDISGNSTGVLLSEE